MESLEYDKVYTLKQLLTTEYPFATFVSSHLEKMCNKKKCISGITVINYTRPIYMTLFSTKYFQQLFGKENLRKLRFVVIM